MKMTAERDTIVGHPPLSSPIPLDEKAKSGEEVSESPSIETCVKNRGFPKLQNIKLARNFWSAYPCQVIFL